jgi:hypothetical protein
MKNKGGNLDAIVALTIATVMGLVVLLMGCGIEATLCWGGWRNSGMGSKWRPLSGCLVEVKPGQWVPEKAVRGFQ